MIEKFNSEELKGTITDNFDKWKETVDEIPRDYLGIPPYALSDDDKEKMTESFENLKEKANLTADEVKKLAEDTWTYTTGVVSEVSKNLQDKTPRFDFKKIGESAKDGATFGGTAGASFGTLAGGGGAILGGIVGAGIGAISGATGEVARQIVLHNGGSEGLATVIKIGTEAVIGVGVAKVAQKTAEGLYYGGKAVASKALETKGGEVVIQQYDDVARFAQDKVKTIGFEAKGLVKNLQTHEFVDGLGKPMMAKIDDVIDFSKTVKMPYIGSHMDNVNSAGFLRDKAVFAKEYLKEFPETLSANNIERIKNGLAPVVDQKWLKFNPYHKTFMGEILEHHHINNTNLAAYVPTSLHRGKLNKDILHMDNMAFGQELLNATKNIITGRS